MGFISSQYATSTVLMYLFLNQGVNWLLMLINYNFVLLLIQFYNELAMEC